MRIVAIGAALALGGCSAILSQPPQATPAGALTECSASVAGAVGDVVLAAVSGGVAMAGLGIGGLEKVRASNETAPSWNPRVTADANADTYLVIGSAAIPVALGLIVSARYGFRSARACRNVTGGFMRERAYP